MNGSYKRSTKSGRRRILCAGGSEVLPEAPEEELAVALRPALDRNAAKHLNAAPRPDLVSPTSDLFRERRQGKVSSGQRSDRLARTMGNVHRAFDLGDVGVLQSLAPIISLPKFAPFPGRWNVERLAQDSLLRPGEVVKRLGGEGLVHVESSRPVRRILCGTIGFSTSRSYMTEGGRR